MNQLVVNQQPTTDLKIMRDIFPDGQVPDWYNPPDKMLALVPGFEQRYHSSRRILNSDGFDYGVVSEIRDFSRDFFGAWEISSPLVLEVCGANQALAMLELFAICREEIWDYGYVTLYEQLPDRVEIFRGGAGSPEEVLKGYSWSLWQAFAEQFAERSANGIVFKAEVAREDILLISQNVEFEVVPRLGALLNLVQIR